MNQAIPKPEPDAGHAESAFAPVLRGIQFVALIILVSLAIFVILFYFYRTNDAFRALFEGKAAAPAQLADGNDVVEAAKAVEKMNKTAAMLSFYILVSILILQAIAFVTAARVFASLRRSKEAAAVRLKKLENADLFLDLPLYFGLLGTVASFIVMSFNPNISRLIAYSSTLVGIIFSVILRLVFQYPLKQKLIGVAAESKQKESEQ